MHKGLYVYGVIRICYCLYFVFILSTNFIIYFYVLCNYSGCGACFSD